MQKGVGGNGIGKRYADRCRAFGTPYEYVVKLSSDKFKFVFTVMTAFAGYVFLVFELAEHKVDYRLHLGIGIFFPLLAIVHFFCGNKGFKVGHTRALKQGVKILVRRICRFDYRLVLTY